MSISIGLLAIASGYLLGSIPSAYLIGRLHGIDLAMAAEDSKLGTCLAFRKLGAVSGITVALMDFSKGMAAIFIARALDVPAGVVLVSGFAAVVGHNWSMFLGFKGGRGAMVSYGVLSAVAFWGLMFAAVVAGIILLFTRKPAFATTVWMFTLTILLSIRTSTRSLPAWALEITPWFIIFPVTLLVPNFLKYSQVQREKRVMERKSGAFSEPDKELRLSGR